MNVLYSHTCPTGVSDAVSFEHLMFKLEYTAARSGEVAEKRRAPKHLQGTDDVIQGRDLPLPLGCWGSIVPVTSAGLKKRASSRSS